jgi:hypothetical protein
MQGTPGLDGLYRQEKGPRACKLAGPSLQTLGCYSISTLSPGYSSAELKVT